MNLVEFVRESNRIEGIRRDPTEEEIEWHRRVLAQPVLSFDLVCQFAAVVTDGYGKLRDQPGMDVSVGAHLPPRGGPEIRDYLTDTIRAANGKTASQVDAYSLHCEFETLHPFMDGNGRTGRVIWAWMTQRAHRDPFLMPFLQRWYYDSLQRSRA